MTDANPLRLSRRRFLAIAASMSAAGALHGAALAAGSRRVTWTGVALGAEASLMLEHPDEAAARDAIRHALDEVARLEAIFSLHRPESALARLNADGRIDDAPADLRILLAEAIRLARRTGGAFDPTIQPLWALYRRHYGAPDADAGGPRDQSIASACRSVGWQRIELDGARIRFSSPGMAITLDGIAQGYITDKVGDLLRARGFRHVLVNMGEQLALGPKRDGESWRIGIKAPHGTEQVIEQLAISGGAVATSGGAACCFDGGGAHSHILDPRTGRPARIWAGVTVVAERATQADGISTALCVLPQSDWASALEPGVRVYAVEAGSSRGRWVEV